MSIENKIHDKLLNHPKLKKIIKRCYQRTMYTFSKKEKCNGNLIKISPDDNKNDYFFGYYDKSPWDKTNRYMLCMKAKDTSKCVAPSEKLEILLIDTQNGNKVEKIAESNSWNVQQGCMAQWLGPDFDKKIIYNDFRNGNYCSVILDVFTKKEKQINMPIYSVSSDGKFALTLDFSRLHRLRPGYGYSNLPDITKCDKLPNKTCMWMIDLENNKVTPYLNYKDFYNFETRREMKNAVHKINHIMISPNNDKFMVIHRWYVGSKKYSRLITCDIKTKKMYNLSDDDMVSHCYWKNNDEIIAFENKKNTGKGYYLMKDKSNEYTHLWTNITLDGHPSYSPDRTLIVTDTYPNKKRICTLKIMNDNEIITIAKVFSPFKYDNDTRCDLHPRWSRDGKNICIDSCHEGRRGVYCLDLLENKNINTKFSIVTPTYNTGEKFRLLIDSLNKQVYKNFELILIDDDSTEKNKKIVKEILKDADFDYKYIENEINKGAGESRNVGIQNTSGDYIIFVDSDDYVSNNLLFQMNNIINKNNTVDIILFDLLYIKNNKSKIIKTMQGFNSGIVNQNDAILYATNCVAGKCIKREMIINNNIKFPNIKRYEDWVFNNECYSKNNKFYYDNTALYYYVNNPTSVVNTNTDIDLESAKMAFEIIKKFNISEDLLNFICMREIDYLYIKKKILRRKINEKLLPYNINKNTGKYLNKKHVKLSKYLILKVFTSSIGRKILAGGKNGKN